MLPVPERHQAALGPGFVPAGSVPPSVGRAGPGAPQLHHPTAGGPPCSVAPLAPLTHTTCATAAPATGAAAGSLSALSPLSLSHSFPLPSVSAATPT